MANEEKNEEENENEEENKPKASKKLLIIGLLAGLIVGGGGAAAGFFLLLPAHDSDGTDDKHEVEEVIEEKPVELPDYQYARMDRLQLPLFYKGRILSYAVMDISLETIGNENKMAIIRNVLIIRDALLRYYSVNSVGREDNPRIVDFDKLSAKILEVANQEIHNEAVTRVVISENRNF